MKLPVNYVHVDTTAAVHLSTIKRYTDDTETFMKYLADSSKRDFFIEPHVQFYSEIEYLYSAHNSIKLAITHFLESGDWPCNEPEPVLLNEALFIERFENFCMTWTMEISRPS